MEIKQGDTVRVSKDTPKMYLRGFDHIFTGVESVVSEVEDDNAVIIFNTDHINSQTTIPTKYLIKVDAEAKEARFKVGDKVVRKNVSTVRTIISIDYVDDDEDPLYYYNTVDSQGNNPMDFVESELILYTESTPKYKKGDRVKFKNIYELQKVKDKSFRWMLVMFASKEATITAVEDNGFYRVDIDPSIGGINDDMIECKVEPTEQTEAEIDVNEELQEIFTPFSLADRIERNHILHRMRVFSQDDFVKEINPAEHEVITKPHYVPKIMFNTEFWVKYEADLAKELAISYAKRGKNPLDAVAAAKEIVKRLKQK